MQSPETTTGLADYIVMNMNDIVMANSDDKAMTNVRNDQQNHARSRK